MFYKDILRRSAAAAALVTIYVGAVATLMSHLDAIFGPGPDKAGDVLAPMLFLLLLVVSVATMGVLIFGRPLMLYIDGKKRDAVATALCTIGSLAVLVVALLAVIAIMRT